MVRSSSPVSAAATALPYQRRCARDVTGERVSCVRSTGRERPVGRTRLVRLSDSARARVRDERRAKVASRLLGQRAMRTTCPVLLVVILTLVLALAARAAAAKECEPSRL